MEYNFDWIGHIVPNILYQVGRTGSLRSIEEVIQ